MVHYANPLLRLLVDPSPTTQQPAAGLVSSSRIGCLGPKSCLYRFLSIPAMPPPDSSLTESAVKPKKREAELRTEPDPACGATAVTGDCISNGSDFRDRLGYWDSECLGSVSELTRYIFSLLIPFSIPSW